MIVVVSRCTHCQAEHTLSAKLLGDTINCPKCDQPFVVTEVRRQTIGYQPMGPSAPATPTRQSLVLPPPPRERWSAKKDDEPDPLFHEFRPNSREVREFLDRHDVSDYSWLLLAGLLFSTVLVLAFMAFVVYLILR